MNHITIVVFMFLGAGVLASDRANLSASDVNVSIYVESIQGVPAFVSGNLATSAKHGDEVAVTMSFLRSHKSDYMMVEPAEEIILKRIENDRSGNRHLRFDQFYHGVRVHWGELISHLDADGMLRAINGSYRPGIDLDISPTIESSEAVGIARSDLSGLFGDSFPGSHELVILPWEGTHFLCWRLILESENPVGRWEYFIDAGTGRIIFKMDAIKGSDEIGTGLSVLSRTRSHIDVWYTGSIYQLRDNTRQINNNIHGHNGQMPDGNFIQTNIATAILPGPVGEDADNYWSTTTQRPGVDAHVYTGAFYDWLLREFGRNSFDNKGANMISTVNWTGDRNGAFWTGSQTVYPMWGSYTRSWASCPDVVGHEWAHAITDHCGVLVYTWESGALNESFSNMMGAAFEFAHDTLDFPDWYIEENAFVYSGYARSMSDPNLSQQPSYYGGPYWVEPEGCIPSQNNDFCGVHINCGVGNKWFYLLSDGETFRGITVEGIGVENAIQIAYHANAYYWTATVNYRDAAIGTYYAALDLDPTGTWAEQVVKAWLAVNVAIPNPGLSFDYPLGIPRTIPYQEASRVEVEISGLVGGVPSPGTGQIHYSVNGGPYVTASMTQESDNYYYFYLPESSCGQTLKYYFSAAEIGGERIYDPDPSSPFSTVVIDNTVILFEDDFESNKGWTVFGDATEGHWERGIPVVSGSNGAPTADYDGSGNCFLTGNTTGNSDVDGGTTNLVSPTFDLEGTEGVVRFARWYESRCSDELIAGDPLYVYVTNDDGNTWELVEIIGPNPEFDGGWVEHQFVVSDFVDPTSLLKLRFEIADEGLPSCVETAIDAVEVIRFECPCCANLTGNIDGSSDDLCDLGDLTSLIDYLFISFTEPACMVAANVDGDTERLVDLGDLTALIDYLFISYTLPAACL